MCKIKINSESIIYVLCPAFFKTGGTELLHQYTDVLLKAGFNCFIVYPDATEKENINPAFLKYVKDYKRLEDIQDDANNIIIIPEVFTKYIPTFKKIRIVLWWESVDNYIRYRSIMFDLKKYHLHPKESRWLIRNIIKRTFKNVSLKVIRKNVDYHFVQSYYAQDFIIQHKLTTEDKIFYVSDYINDLYLEKHPQEYVGKENIVCYNPAKGAAFTSKIIKKCPEIKFVPLVNMTNEQVFDTLKRAKAYIDFGDHPGKDRFPREAAIMGCCIFTNRVGAANYYKDIPIKDEYKFKQKSSSIKYIKKALLDCLSNYDEKINDYDEYRKMILGEKDVFFDNVVNCYLR